MPHLSAGHRCADLHELRALLRDWVTSTTEPTVSGGTDASTGYVRVALGGVECVLAGDTSRAGVEAFLAATDEPGSLWVVPSRRGITCRVAVGDPPAPVPGFYLYTDGPFGAPLLLDAPQVADLRILQGVAALHRRGHQQVRIMPGLSPSGMAWRLSITDADNLDEHAAKLFPREQKRTLDHSSAAGGSFAGIQVTASSSPDDVADAILARLPGLATPRRDWPYAGWYAELLGLVERHAALPVAFADYPQPITDWRVGSQVRFPRPPRPAGP